MRRLAIVVCTVLVAGAVPGSAKDDAAVHSRNMSLVANWDAGGKYRQGSDLAFWGDLAVLGNYNTIRLIDISEPADPRLVGHLDCIGPQGDVSVWRDLVFVSVDSPRATPECGADAASVGQNMSGEAWEGIRILSIADPSQPRQVAFVKTDCGSHTHTLVPDPDANRVLLYVESYPLGVQYPSCNVGSHRKISVVEVPLGSPADATVVETPGVSPAIGCHDVTVHLGRKLAAAACISESQIWSIRDPAKPKVIAHIYNPAINIHHSATFSNDGRKIAIGDELGGAAFAPGCLGSGHMPLGSIWFYSVKRARSPSFQGFYQIPQNLVSTFCTAHNLNTVPLRSGRDVLVSGWYRGGTSVVDFTKPSRPRQLGYYTIVEGVRSVAWSSYWYRGKIYVNNYDDGQASRGFDVLDIDHPRLADAVWLDRLNPQTME